MTALWAIVLCGALSIVYAIWATASVLKADAGNPRMQEIAAAVFYDIATGDHTRVIDERKKDGERK